MFVVMGGGVVRSRMDIDQNQVQKIKLTKIARNIIAFKDIYILQTCP